MGWVALGIAITSLVISIIAFSITVKTSKEY